MPVNLSKVAASRTNWPAWNLRGRLKRVDSSHNVIEGEWACQGEFVRVSPRYLKNGQTFRVRPERPAAFLAAWLYERGVLPTPLTPEEAESEWGLEFLDAYWPKYKGYFPKLESPNAACDQMTQPSHRNGFSFCVLQVLVEEVGSVHDGNGMPGGMMTVQFPGNGENHELLRRRIEEMRAKAGVRPEPAAPAKAKK